MSLARLFSSSGRVFMTGAGGWLNSWSASETAKEGESVHGYEEENAISSGRSRFGRPRFRGTPLVAKRPRQPEAGRVAAGNAPAFRQAGSGSNHSLS